MATSPTQSRFGRRAFLGIAYGAALMIALTWFDNLHPVLRATLPMRVALVGGVGIAVHLRWLRQDRGEEAMFWIGLGLVVLRLWFMGDVPIERAALTVIAAGSLMLPLALLIAPRHRRPVWAAVTVGLCLVAGGVSIIPVKPAGFVALAAYMGFLWMLLMGLERHARTADEAWGMAHTDSLTGLANRRALQIQLEQVTADPDDGDSLLLVDLDRFKALNDAAGHAAGDEALRLVAAVMRGVVTDRALVGRWGGEEFVVLLRGSEARHAENIAERVRAAIEGASPVTASIGVAHLVARDDVFSWMQRADAALYRAKSGGRNRVVVEAAADAAFH